jgi:chromate transporter
MRALPQMKHFLKGVGITAASLILMTAIRQTIALDQTFVVYGVVLIATLLLLSKKIPAPLIIVLAAIAGFFL